MTMVVVSVCMCDVYLCVHCLYACMFSPCHSVFHCNEYHIKSLASWDNCSHGNYDIISFGIRDLENSFFISGTAILMHNRNTCEDRHISNSSTTHSGKVARQWQWK